MMILTIRVLNLYTNIKSGVWLICHCFGLNHETTVCAVCLFVFLFTISHRTGVRQNQRDGVSNHQCHDCLLNRLFKGISKKTSKLRVTGLYEGNSPVKMFPFDDVIMKNDRSYIPVYSMVLHLHNATYSGKWKHYMGLSQVSYINATSLVDIIGPMGIQTLLVSIAQEVQL